MLVSSASISLLKLAAFPVRLWTNRYVLALMLLARNFEIALAISDLTAPQLQVADFKSLELHD
jgi:hypothetical protein